MLTITSGSATDPGKVRAHNEDSVLALSPLFAVADGMGGHAAGEVASGLAVARLRDLATGEDLRPDDVRAQLVAANSEILTFADADPVRYGMGTTVTGMCLVQVAGLEHWIVFNIGDSRVYRYTNATLDQLTVDHSEVEELVAAGKLTAGQAREHPRRNVVTRALGTDPPPEPDLWLFPPTAGDRYLICSDGLPLELTDQEIIAVLSAEPDPQRAADTLVAEAVAAGGRDNVTVVVVDTGEVDSDPGATLPRTRPHA